MAHGRWRIALIVEDEVEYRALRHMLTVSAEARFDVTWVATYNAALDVMKRQQYDMYLVNHQLGTRSSVELLREVVQHGCRGPWIVLTPPEQSAVGEAALQEGATDYLDKRHLGTPLVERVLRHAMAYTQKERLLEERERLFTSLIANSIEGVLIHRDFTPVFANRALAEMFGYDSAEAILCLPSIEPLIAPREYERLQQYAGARCRGEEAPEHYEFQGRRKDGTLIWVDSKVTMVNWEGKPAVQAFLFDITARKGLESRLPETQKMEAIGTLAGGIAHDFNNILTAIMGFTELALYDVPPDSKARGNLQDVLVAGQRARDLVRQILTFSRQSDTERKPLHLSLLVKEGLRLLRATLPSTIDIRQHLQDNACVVLANTTQLQQVLMNLCTNAAHAMRETGGILEVSLEAMILEEELTAFYPALTSGPYVRLSVRDTGPGMMPDILERIFEPFFTTKEAGIGTGMGLAVVHGIVTSHDGVVTVTSQPGYGTTCEVYLPRLNIAAEDDSDPQEAIAGGTERILFVDDEEMLARLGYEILSHLGYHVEVRTSSLEALETFRADPQRFDLVITDQTMPNMTGERLARALRRLRPDIPLILCTGFSYTISPEKAQAAGIDAFCMKPLTIRDLDRVIREVLRHRTVER